MICNWPETGAAATVIPLLGGDSIDLPVGRLMTFGRHGDIQLAHPAISKIHGTLFAGPHFVAATRLPGKAEIWVNRFDASGPVVIDDGATVIIDRAAAHLRILLNELDIERRQFQGGFNGQREQQPSELDSLFGVAVLEVRVHGSISAPLRAVTEESTTIAAVPDLRTHQDLVVLVALCERLLGADPVAALHLPKMSEIAQRLTAIERPLTARRVSNLLVDWRNRLGLPPTEGSRCHCSLAVAAIQSGLVTVADLHLLNSTAR